MTIVTICVTDVFDQGIFYWITALEDVLVVINWMERKVELFDKKWAVDGVLELHQDVMQQLENLDGVAFGRIYLKECHKTQVLSI